MTDFNGKLSVVCAAVGTAGAAVAEALGGWDNGVITLIIFMVLGTGRCCKKICFINIF